MNDRQDPHGEQQIYGYDAYGRPVYHDPYAQQAYPSQGGQPAQYDQPGHPAQPGPYGQSDPYGQGNVHGPPGAYDGYGQGGYDQPGPYGQPSQYDQPGPYGQPGQYDQPDAYQTYGPYPSAEPAGAGYGALSQPPAHDPHAPHSPYGPDSYEQPPQYGAPYAWQQGDSGQGAYDTGAAPSQALSSSPPVPHQDAGPAQPYPAPQPHPPVDPGAAPFPPRAPRQRRPAESETEPAHGLAPHQPHADTGQQRQVEDATPSGPALDTGTETAGSGGEDAYQTEQFSFIEEQDEESEDVIDWLKFTESRTERREEARRRGRNRIIALVVALTVALAGGVGYLWYAGELPGLSAEEGAEAAAADTRHVIAVHLRETDSDEISTALLINNETAGKGTMLLLPNSLALSGEDGTTTTLGKSFGSDGAGATRDALDALLGANIGGTWRLDTPYLEVLVDSVGGITLEADATVPGEAKDDAPFTRKGQSQEVTGQGATAYATYRAKAEPQTKQLARFGQVMEEVLKKVSTDKEAATGTVETLGQVLDFSLTEAELGAALANLAKHAKNEDYETSMLPVEADGTLSEETAQGTVKEALGGSVKNADPDAAARLTVRNASGTRGAADGAQVTLVNGGFTVVSTGAAERAVARSTVTYTQDAHEEEAKEAARTLGLPEGSVKKGEGAANADVTVVLGQDYDGG